jgi:hypothetical protein
MPSTREPWAAVCACTSGPIRTPSLSVLSTRVSDALDANRQRFVGLIRRPSVGTWSYSDSEPLVAAAFGAGQLDLEAFIDLLDRDIIPAVMRVPGCRECQPQPRRQWQPAGLVRPHPRQRNSGQMSNPP